MMNEINKKIITIDLSMSYLEKDKDFIVNYIYDKAFCLLTKIDDDVKGNQALEVTIDTVNITLHLVVTNLSFTKLTNVLIVIVNMVIMMKFIMIIIMDLIIIEEMLIPQFIWLYLLIPSLIFFIYVLVQILIKIHLVLIQS